MLGLVFQYQAKTFGGKNVSAMTYSVSSVTYNLNSVNLSNQLGIIHEGRLHTVEEGGLSQMTVC